MKRIFILQDHLRGGGTERQSIELTQALLKDQLPAQLLVGYSGGDLDDLAKKNLGNRVRFLSQHKSTHSIRSYWTLYRLTTEAPCLLICMGRWSHCLSALLPSSKKLQRISTVRTSRALPFLYRRCIQKSSALMTNSHWALEATRLQMADKQLPNSAVIHNALSRPELLKIDAEQRAVARSKFDLDEKTKVLLSVARLEAGKGHADLLKAVSSLKENDWQLWLLGQGPEEDSLREQARHLKIEARVHFIGFCQDPALHFAAANLFVSASTLDSLPNALIEAHAAGLPIVAYPSQGIPEIVDAEQTGLLCAENTPTQLADNIERLINHPERCLKMGVAARTKVQSHFDRVQQNSRFCSHIRHVMNDAVPREMNPKPSSSSSTSQPETLRKQVIWQIVDGKPGHENQSSGLIMALQARGSYEVIRINALRSGVTWPQYLLKRFKSNPEWKQPDLIIGAGSQTHPTLLAAKRTTQAPVVVIMSPPRLIQSWFELCIVPEHDKRKGNNVIQTKGALNTIRPSDQQDPCKGLFLIGGPSKHHGWHEDLLLKQIQEILKHQPEMRWKLTTSRRTPKSTLEALNQLDTDQLTIYPVEHTPQGWVAEKLAESSSVWVTEDSVSMVYEALTSGANVGLLQIPRLSDRSRVIRGLDRLVEQDMVQRYQRAGAKVTKPKKRFPLHEGDRVASIVETRLLNND